MSAPSVWWARLQVDRAGLVADLLAAVKAHEGRLRPAARELGIPLTTIARMVRQIPEFKAGIKAIRAELRAAGVPLPGWPIGESDERNQDDSEQIGGSGKGPAR